MSIFNEMCDVLFFRFAIRFWRGKTRRWRRGFVDIFADDDVGSGGLGPQSVHLRADAVGSDDRAGWWLDGWRLLDNVFKGGVEVCLTPGDEAGGMGVAVNRGVVGEAEFVDDTVGVAPAEEGVFDVFAVGARQMRHLRAWREGGWCCFDRLVLVSILLLSLRNGGTEDKNPMP
jgi:hypothetical protein